MLSSAHSAWDGIFASSLERRALQQAKAPELSPLRRVARARSNSRAGIGAEIGRQSRQIVRCAAAEVGPQRQARGAQLAAAVSSTRAISRLAARLSSCHNRLSSRRLSMSGVRMAPSFWTMASSWSGSKLPLDPALADQIAPAASLPVAISASPSRILPMALTGSRPANQAMTAAGVGRRIDRRLGAGEQACRATASRDCP